MIDPRLDICECGHSRAEHGGLDGHGSCKHHGNRSVDVAAFQRHACPQFTWSHILTRDGSAVLATVTDTSDNKEEERGTQQEARADSSPA